MTKISYIHGLDAEERRQRAGEIPGPSYINYTALTEGELQLTLLAEQVQMLAAYYPEDKELQKSKNLLIDALYRGVHRAGALPGGIVTGRLATVVAAIRNARNLARPAAVEITGRKKAISGGIGDPLIPYEDCEVIVDDPNDPLGVWSYTDNECIKRNNIKKILNDGLEKGSHHILYEFVTNPNAAPSIVAVKTQNHRAAVATISQISKLSQTSMKMWVRNGVIRHNLIQGAGALQPEETIATIKSGATQVAGIGEPLTAAALLAILKAIAAAIGAIATLVMLLKQKDPQTAALWNQFQGIGTGVWGPEQTDWYTGGGAPPAGTQPGAGSDLEKYLPYGLMLAGAYVLLDN